MTIAATFNAPDHRPRDYRCNILQRQRRLDRFVTCQRNAFELTGMVDKEAEVDEDLLWDVDGRIWGYVLAVVDTER